MAAAISPENWVSDEALGVLSRELHDPSRLAVRRREALDRFRVLPLEPDPLYRQYGYFAGVDLAGADAAARGSKVAQPAPGSRTVQAVHDAAGTHLVIPPELREEGVAGDPLPAIWHEGDPAALAFLGEPHPHQDRLSALADALVNRGYRLKIPPRLAGAVRLQDLMILSRPHEALSVHRVIEVGEGSSLLTTEESYSGPGAAPGQRFLASSTHLEVGPEARCAHLTLHAPDPQAVSVYGRRARVHGRGHLTWIWNGLGGFRSRIRNLTELPGNGSQVEDLQTFYGDHSQSYDSSIQITHLGTDTHGQSVTRGVFRDESRGMSRGLVRIEREARKTLSYLSEHAMLLSKGARSDTIPILEILCRDVKATHSTSVAPVDPEKIFYLESRGMSESDSIRMVGEGFLSHVLERSPVRQLREILYPYLAARWEGRSIPWDPAALPQLPELSVSGREGTPDWRFDAKLR